MCRPIKWDKDRKMMIVLVVYKDRYIGTGGNSVDTVACMRVHSKSFANLE